MTGDAGLPASDATAYLLTGHACRHCGGRVLQANDTFRCSGCGVIAIQAPDSICGCGILTGPRAGAARFRCGPNPTKSEASPSEVVILFGDRAVAA